MAYINTGITIKSEPREEDWMLADYRHEFDVWDGMNNKGYSDIKEEIEFGKKQSPMVEDSEVINEEIEVKVKDEVGVNVNIDKYLRMWKSLYPLVNDKTKISIYKNNNGNIRQTMAEIREMDENEKIKKKMGVQNVQCSHCDKIFSNKNGLISHLANHKKVTTENQNLKEVPSENLKKVIVKVEIKTNVKEEVGVTISFDKYLRMWKSLYPLVNDETKISIYNKNNGNIRHTMAKIRELNENEKIKKEKGVQNVQCSHCDKIFPNKNGLDRHLTNLKKITRDKLNLEEVPSENLKEVIGADLKKITREIQHECKHCEKTFSDKKDFITHLEVHNLKVHIDGLKLHPEEKPYMCSHCGKAFSWKSQLKQHLRWINTMDKPYECNYCNKTSLWKCQIKAHEATHI